MKRKKKHQYFYLQISIIFTLIVIFLYLTLYLFSTTGNQKGIKLSSDTCKEFGGICRDECLESEISKTKCKNEQICCVIFYPENPEDKVYLKYAVDDKDISFCNKILSDLLKASCKLQVMDLLITFSLL